MKNLFITGAYRSGTTITEKLLHSHNDVSVASQPMPLLYFVVKSAFLRELGVSQRYPLDHNFMQEAYSPNDFVTYLETFRVTKDIIRDVLDGLDGYIGLWTENMQSIIKSVPPNGFLEYFQSYHFKLAEELKKADVLYSGSKEIVAEEFMPFFLKHNVKCLLIVRDPRDMIASVNFRDRDNQTGKNRPILYSLRIWRKSVAYALAYGGDPNFHFVRYEDLATHPEKTLSEIAEFLGIPPFECEKLSQGIVAQDGSVWHGNSSFNDHHGISTTSLGQYQSRLSESVIRYIETLCLPEMKVLGYTPSRIESFDAAALNDFQVPFEDIHDKFPYDYSVDKKNLAAEIQRWDMLHTPDMKQTCHPYFLFESARRLLARGGENG